MSRARARPPATVVDLLAISEAKRFHEVIGGELVQKATPTGEHARDDQVTKFETYRRCGVPHYWIADPTLATLRVFRWTSDGYLVALNAQAGQRVRAEPFEAIEIEVGVLFGEDPEGE